MPSAAARCRLESHGVLELHGELRCGDISVPVKKSTASHHFKTLLAAGIIAERQQGTRKLMHLRRTELEERFPGLIDSVLRATAPPAG